MHVVSIYFSCSLFIVLEINRKAAAGNCRLGIPQHYLLHANHRLTRLRNYRASGKEHIFISKLLISSPNPMFNHLLESSHRDDSNKWSNKGFGEEITQAVSIEVKCTLLIWDSVIIQIMTLAVLDPNKDSKNSS